MFNGNGVSVVMPAYNEEENITNAVSEFKKNIYVDEVVVVDNNSRDRTCEYAKRAGAIVVSEKRQGYGFACRRAMKSASKDLIVLVEPDGTFSDQDLLKLLAYMGDFDFVLGTRTSKNMIWKGSNMGPFLRWGNWFLGKLIEVLYGGPRLTDVGCTYRVISKDLYRRIEGTFTSGSTFSPDMIISAIKARASIAEIPVHYMPRIGTSKITGKKWKAFKLGLKMIKVIVCRRFGS
jgi:glycosyltransferase involved in cell wall biosynthesis